MNRKISGAMLLLALLAGCGGASTHAPYGFGYCSTIAPPGLVYPVNGATGVPDSFTLVLSYGASPVQLQSGAAAPVALQPAAVPSPLPTPNRGATSSSAGYATGALQPHTTYNVLAPIPQCMSAPVQGVIGTFTTS